MIYLQYCFFVNTVILYSSIYCNTDRLVYYQFSLQNHSLKTVIHFQMTYKIVLYLVILGYFSNIQ